MDVYNTHLKNLINAYIKNEGVEIVLGYDTFLYSNFIPDVIHFHMVEGLLNTLDYNFDSFFIKLDYYKKNKVKIIYTVHDLFPHSKVRNVNYIEFFNQFFKFIDLFVHHGSSSINIFKNTFEVASSSHHIICPHGDYLADMSSFNVTKTEARRKLGLNIDKRIILVFGQIQHKNLSFVNMVFKKYKKIDKKSFLVIAGVNPIFKYNSINQFFYKINNKWLNHLRFDKKIMHRRFTNYELYLYFKASDVVFLPHSYGMTSGLIPMAATLSVPFVFPRIGCFEDQAMNTLSESYEVNNVDEAILAIYKLLSLNKLTYDNSKWLLENSWDIHAKTIIDKLKLPSKS